MIDEEGFRANVGIILSNSSHQVLWARRCNKPEAWQFPQGGIQEGETPLAAMYRELEEELGLESKDVECLGSTEDWLSYLLPVKFRRLNTKPLCIGQKQKWFLLRLLSDDTRINLAKYEKPEFDQWNWVDYWFPLKQVVEFKQEVYQAALEKLEPYLTD